MTCCGLLHQIRRSGRGASRVLPGNYGSGTAWVGLVGKPSFTGPKAPMFYAPGDLPWRAINGDTTISRADLLGLLKLPFCKKIFCPARVLNASYNTSSGLKPSKVSSRLSLSDAIFAHQTSIPGLGAMCGPDALGRRNTFGCAGHQPREPLSLLSHER